MMTNDDTLYRTNDVQDNEQNVNDTNQTEVEGKTEKNKGSNTAARAAAVAAGVVAGGGVAYAVDNIPFSHDEPAPVENATMKVTTEDDSLSFEEAFNDARAQIGPGGAFRWHGGIYSTYTENEWANMSDAEKAEFNAKIEPLASGTERMASTYDNNTSHHDATSHTTTNHIDNKEVVEENTTKVVITQEDNYHISSEETAVIQGQEVIIGRGTHNGKEMVVVDVDRDGNYDFIVEDVNQDGEISDNEVIDISDRNIEVGNHSLLADNTTPPTPPADDSVVEIITEDTDVVNGKEVIIAEGTYDNHNAVFIDINKDGTYDTAAIDFNDNNQIDEGEIVDARGAGIHVEDRSLIGYNDLAQADPSITDANLDDPSQGLPDYAPDYV